MMCWLNELNENEQRGSRPRCLLFLQGDRPTVAARLQSLVSQTGVQVTASDFWMPLGPPERNEDGHWNFALIREARLGEDEGFLAAQERDDVTNWWLAVSRNANTPNWDIASTATICGKQGFLLVEAKAHDLELKREEAGKYLRTPVTSNSRRNHVRIGACIQEASLALADATKQPWALSRDWNYQMSNRFAWSWKLTEMGYPVVLIYLGFLGAEEMRAPSQVPFTGAEQWTDLVKEHSSALFPEEIWNTRWDLHGRAFFPLIRSIECSLNVGLGEAGA